MLFLQQPLDGGSGVSHREGSPVYTLWTGDLLQVSHRVVAALKMRADVLTTHDAEGLGEQPMTIQEAIKKAIEGGYHLNGADGMDTDDAGAHRACSAWTRNDTDSTWVAGVKEALLDPHFWRALGLALGWHERVETKCLIYQQWWRQPWHRFIDHLADGYTPEAFFARVPCPQPAASRRQYV
jgi:hypothetical protein